MLGLKLIHVSKRGPGQCHTYHSGLLHRRIRIAPIDEATLKIRGNINHESNEKNPTKQNTNQPWACSMWSWCSLYLYAASGRTMLPVTFFRVMPLKSPATCLYVCQLGQDIAKENVTVLDHVFSCWKPSVTSGFPWQNTSNAETVSML